MPLPPLRLIFLGAPGVGKGTYATQLTKKWGIPHISTGDMVRAEMKKKTPLGEQFALYAKVGKLVPEEMIAQLAKGRLEMDDCKNGWLLDGFPRNIKQAQLFSEFATPTICVNIFLPPELLVQKLTARRVCKDCGRNYNLADIRYGDYDMPPLLPQPSDCDKCHGQPNLEQREDDTETIVLDRLKVYEDETSPLIQYYEEKGLLTSFEVKKGIKDMPRIEGQILDFLG